MTTIANVDEDPILKEEIEKKLTRLERATVRGVLQEQEILKQKLDACYEKLNRMTALYGTAVEEIKQLRLQYVKVVNLRMNGGPTE